MVRVAYDIFGVYVVSHVVLLDANAADSIPANVKALVAGFDSGTTIPPPRVAGSPTHQPDLRIGILIGHLQAAGLLTGEVESTYSFAGATLRAFHGIDEILHRFITPAGVRRFPIQTP